MNTRCREPGLLSPALPSRSELRDVGEGSRLWPKWLGDKSLHCSDLPVLGVAELSVLFLPVNLLLLVVVATREGHPPPRPLGTGCAQSSVVTDNAETWSPTDRLSRCVTLSRLFHLHKLPRRPSDGSWLLWLLRPNEGMFGKRWAQCLSYR